MIHSLESTIIITVNDRVIFSKTSQHNKSKLLKDHRNFLQKQLSFKLKAISMAKLKYKERKFSSTTEATKKIRSSDMFKCQKERRRKG